jgi:hypothetical protein
MDKFTNCVPGTPYVSVTEGLNGLGWALMNAFVTFFVGSATWGEDPDIHVSWLVITGDSYVVTPIVVEILNSDGRACGNQAE